MNIPPCRKCGQSDWLPVPDSLAVACKACGAVLVEAAGGGWEDGASLQEWAADLATPRAIPHAEARKLARKLWKRLGEKDPRSFPQFARLVRKLGPAYISGLEALTAKAIADGSPDSRRKDGEPRTPGGIFLRLARRAYNAVLAEKARLALVHLAPGGRLDAEQADRFVDAAAAPPALEGEGPEHFPTPAALAESFMAALTAPSAIERAIASGAIRVHEVSPGGDVRTLCPATAALRHNAVEVQGEPVLEGIHPGELVVVGGRPSAGRAQFGVTLQLRDHFTPAILKGSPPGGYSMSGTVRPPPEGAVGPGRWIGDHWYPERAVRDSANFFLVRTDMLRAEPEIQCAVCERPVERVEQVDDAHRAVVVLVVRCHGDEERVELTYKDLAEADRDSLTFAPAFSRPKLPGR